MVLIQEILIGYYGVLQCVSTIGGIRNKFGKHKSAESRVFAYEEVITYLKRNICTKITPSGWESSIYSINDAFDFYFLVPVHFNRKHCLVGS